jgi:hypothetical protein
MIENPFSDDVLFGLFVFSLVSFVGTLIAIPYILVRIPPNYFDTRDDHRIWLENHHPVLRLMGVAAKNLLGLIFLLAGFAMLFLPGQGILTMLIGVSLLDFPGRRHLERRLIGRPSVLQAINKVRKKFGKPPLEIKDDP